MAIQFKVYNGKEFAQVTAEPEVDENGVKTGHYKELKKEFISIDGILDDTQILNGTIDMINNYKQTYNSNYYLLTGYGDIILFSSYALVPEYPSLGQAVVSYIMGQSEWLVESVEDNGIYITFKIFIRSLNQKVDLKLSAQAARTFAP